MKKLHVLSLSLIALLMVNACEKTKTSDSPSNTTNPSETSTPEPIPSDSSSATPSDTVSQEPIVVYVEEGDETTAVANPGKFYYQKDAESSVSGVVEDGVSKISVSGVTAYNSVTLYYKAQEVVKGGRYEISFSIVSKAVMQDVTINGTVYTLSKGSNDFTFRTTESDGATVTIILGDENNETVTASNELQISTPIITPITYKALTTITLDGNLEEWAETKNEENSIGVYGTEDYEGKSVTFYAALKEDGLYLAAEAYHGYYVADNDTWWKATNFEFFIGENNAQGWISANGSKQLVTESSWNTQEDTEGVGYHTIVEAFIPEANLPSGSVVNGEIRVGFAWKTDDGGDHRDLCNNGEGNGGAEETYWVPKGTWTNNSDKAYVTEDGIFRSSQINFSLSDFSTVTLDGHLSDWEGIQGVTLQGSDATSYKDVTWYARLTSEGMFLAAKAHHDEFIDNGDAWHTSTNFEFWVSGNNQKYISANGQAAGGVYGTYTTRAYTEGEANYETIFELVIPNLFLKSLLKEDQSVSVGFAWKTPGDVITGGGANNGNEDPWWILPGRSQTDANQQFTVTENGLVDPLAD